MTTQFTLGLIVREVVGYAVRAYRQTWPWLLLFAALFGLISGIHGLDAPQPDWLMAMALLVLFCAGCFWSAALYRQMLKLESAPRASTGVGRLMIANGLVYMLFGLVGFIASLALIIVSGVLTAVSGFDPSQVAPDDVSGSMQAMRESGAIWVLYVAGVASILVLAWFAVRLLLFGAATVALGRVVVFQTWGWTKGKIIELGRAVVVLQLGPLVLLSALNEGLAYVFGVPTLFSPDRVAQATGLGSAFFGFIWMLVMSLYIVLGHGLSVAVFRRLQPAAS